MIGNWNWLDLFALAVVLVSVLAALFKGLAAELISLASVIFGLFAAIVLYSTAGLLLQSLGVTVLIANLLGFLVVFACCLVAGALAVRWANTVLRVLRLKWADRLLGGAFGLMRGWLIVAIVFLALAAFPVGSRQVAESRSAAFFLTSAGLLVEITPRDFKSKFEAGYREIYQRWIEPAPPEKDQP